MNDVSEGLFVGFICGFYAAYLFYHVVNALRNDR